MAVCGGGFALSHASACRQGVMDAGLGLGMAFDGAGFVGGGDGREAFGALFGASVESRLCDAACEAGVLRVDALLPCFPLPLSSRHAQFVLVNGRGIGDRERRVVECVNAVYARASAALGAAVRPVAR